MISNTPNSFVVLFLCWSVNKIGKFRGIKINEKDNNDSRQSEKEGK